MTASNGLLKMSELAERSGVSAATIKHYLREGLLPEPVKTSRNMAWYPPEHVERLRLIKRLQEQRFMPLKAIRRVLEEEDPERLSALVDVEDRILERAVRANETGSARVSRAEVRRRYEVPDVVLERLAELGVLTPNGRGYDAYDVQIIEAIARFRAGGYDERLGFTVYETLRYREALGSLVEDEVRTLLDRLAGEVDVDRAAEIIASGAQPLRDLIGAMHSKLLLSELKRQRSARG
ncbi:MAG: MerR family transcriptional regulator [Actinomycetota bacterium]|nr:MerR family transcriptional regulator [Actinomycetota bacterium]